MSEEQTSLSDREIEIVRLVATGATNQEIAQKLYISANTVKVHLRNIYVKLDVASRTEATMYAVRQGWVEVPRPENGAKEALESEATPLLPTLPRIEPRPHVSMAKRIALMAAILLALLALVLPPVLQGKGNGTNGDPIGGVFPTEATGPSTTRWRTRAQMPTSRTDLAVVAYEGLIYAIGGVSNDGVTGRVEVYDPQTDGWTTRANKPTPVGFASAAEVGGKIYVPGGFDAGRQPLDILEVYDPVQDLWQSRAPLPRPLGAYGLAVLDGKLYLFGGRDQAGYLASTYRYDPEADAWEELQPMDHARGFLGAAALQDRIYIVGGYDDVTEFRTCEVYDPVADRWASCAPMNTSRGGLALVPVRDYLYAIGGGMNGYLAFNERYDPRTDTWRRFETPITEQWRGMGAASIYPQLYAIGGWNGDFLSVNEAYQALYQIVLPSIGE